MGFNFFDKFLNRRASNSTLEEKTSIIEEINESEVTDITNESLGSTQEDEVPLDKYNQYKEIYSDNNLKEKVFSSIKSLSAPVLEDIYFLYYLCKDEHSPIRNNKALIALIIGVLGYFILPIDIIADYIPGAGFVDDIAALSSVVATVIATIKKSNPEIDIEHLKANAKKTANGHFNN